MTVDVVCSAAYSTKIQNSQQGNGGGVTPNKSDVLMGRGNSHKNHPGNIIFQGLIKKFRKQYFQVDTLLNKRNTITEIINQCHSIGARFLEQKSRSDKTGEAGKDIEWTILTKERTFRKVSLAIQYRQRCNASATTATPTDPTSSPKLEPNKLTPCSSPENRSSSENGPTPNVSRPKSEIQGFNVGTEKFGQPYGDRGFLERSQVPPPPLTSEMGKDKSRAYPMMYRSTNANDEFISGYEDSMNWMAQPTAAASSNAPWSLPFLSHAMSSLPLHPSSINLRQRPINYGEMRYGNNACVDNSNEQYYNNMMQFVGIRNNTSDRSAPGAYQSHQQQGSHYQRKMIPNDLYLNDDHGDDPVPMSEVFHQRNYIPSLSGMNQQQQQNWYRSSKNEPSSLSVYTVTDANSPQQHLCTPDASPLQQKQHLHEEQQIYVNQQVIRRVSNFEEQDNGQSSKNMRQKNRTADQKSWLSSSSSTIATEQSKADSGCDEALSTTCSMTIGSSDILKDFPCSSSCMTGMENNNSNIDHDFDTTSICDVIVDIDEEEEDQNNHHISSNSTIYSCGTKGSSILHNDLCLSPFFESDESPYDDNFMNNMMKMMDSGSSNSNNSRSTVWI